MFCHSRTSLQFDKRVSMPCSYHNLHIVHLFSILEIELSTYGQWKTMEQGHLVQSHRDRSNGQTLIGKGRPRPP